jgi:hypothetical protein
MADIRMFPCAPELGGIGFKNGKVVQHGSFFDKIKIRFKMGNPHGNFDGFIGHLAPMFDKDLMGSGAGFIKFGYDIKWAHRIENCRLMIVD